MHLLSSFRFSHIIETGTYLGISTEFLARESRLPVLTVEAVPVNYYSARLRLRPYANVQSFLGDSRSFLRGLTVLVPPSRSFPLFYLDAHWEEDLPLLEEVETIFEQYHRCVILIDDFAVPGDQGYGFDDYGAGKTLCKEYLQSAIASFRPIVAYPRLPSARESGGKRGCVLLASSVLEADFAAIHCVRVEVPKTDVTA